jgi:hypothetical protein
MPEIEVRNDHEVDSSDKGVWMHKPPGSGQTLSHDEAMLLAAHLATHANNHALCGVIEVMSAIDMDQHKPEGPATTGADSGGKQGESNTQDGQ